MKRSQIIKRAKARRKLIEKIRKNVKLPMTEKLRFLFLGE